LIRSIRRPTTALRMTRFGTCMSVSVPRHARRFALAITPFQKQCRAIPTRTTLQPCVFARAAFPASRSASSTPVRSPLYAQIEERDVRFFEEILGKARLCSVFSSFTFACILLCIISMLSCIYLCSFALPHPRACTLSTRVHLCASFRHVSSNVSLRTDFCVFM